MNIEDIEQEELGQLLGISLTHFGEESRRAHSLMNYLMAIALHDDDPQVGVDNYETYSRLVEFVEDNNERLPSKKSEDADERALAEFMHDKGQKLLGLMKKFPEGYELFRQKVLQKIQSGEMVAGIDYGK